MNSLFKYLNRLFNFFIYKILIVALKQPFSKSNDKIIVLR